MGTVLIVEDNETMREGISLSLEKIGHRALPVKSGKEALKVFDAQPVDFVITDLKMEEMDGMAVLKALRQKNPDLPVMIITAYGTVETAVEAMKEGAFDFITKPFSHEQLRMKCEKAFELMRMRAERERLLRETEYYREEDQKRFNFGEIIGKSPSMQDIYRTIQKVAQGESSVCIFGESGTGKELVARAIHYQSPRRDKPFIKANCSAFAETLLESELFGHEKGAFTGAIRQKPGRFELAHTGTLFLDEIGDMSPPLQLKLLRVLQEKEFERVGGTETIKVDTRIISATNKDLMGEIRQGRFREDLFYRLHVVPITIPPLRERKVDIPILVDHILKSTMEKTGRRVKGLSNHVMDVLQEYHWPGNIRELENVIEQSLVLCEGEYIKISDLPLFLSRPQTQEGVNMPAGSSLPEMLDNLEKQLILKAYEKAGGNKSETARLLGIKTSALYYKLEKYGIQ